MTGKRGTPLERFERFYIPEPNTGCWLWLGSINEKTGYGQLGMPGSVPMRAHRLSYQLFNGKLKKGLDVRHTCDVRCCVNPEHLLLGTRKQNMEDCAARGRIACGFMLPQTKLSDADIESLLLDNRPAKEVGKTYGVSANYVCVLRKVNGVKYARLPACKGENAARALLTNKQAQKIRELYATGKHKQKTLGEKFGVCQNAISQIILGRTYV